MLYLFTSCSLSRCTLLIQENKELHELANLLEFKLNKVQLDGNDIRPKSHQLWDPSRGVSGEFSESLRLLVMKLRAQNIAISKISAIISLFVDHFDFDIDLSRLPSTRTISRIVSYEMDILANAQIGYVTAILKKLIILCRRVTKTLESLASVSVKLYSYRTILALLWTHSWVLL